MDEFTKHYISQAGGGSGAEGAQISSAVYKAGFNRSQKGSSLSGLLSKFTDWVSPLFKSGVQSLGREALKTGTDILADASSARSSGELKEITTRRLTEGRDRLARKMEGSGRRRTRKRRGRKSKRTVRKQFGMGRKRRTVRKGGPRRRRRVARSKEDIFGGYK